MMRANIFKKQKVKDTDWKDARKLRSFLALQMGMMEKDLQMERLIKIKMWQWSMRKEQLEKLGKEETKLKKIKQRRE